MGEATPGVEAGEVTRSEGEEGEPDTASATLTWTWPLGEDGATEWSYDATAELTLVDDAWRVAWSPTLVEPSLNDASVLDLTPIAARRGKITGARGLDMVTERRVVRVGIDRSQAQKKRAVAVRSFPGPARRGRRCGVRRPGPGRRRPGLRGGDRLPPGRGARRGWSRAPNRIPGGAADRRPGSAGPTRELRRPASWARSER